MHFARYQTKRDWYQRWSTICIDGTLTGTPKNLCSRVALRQLWSVKFSTLIHVMRNDEAFVNDSRFFSLYFRISLVGEITMWLERWIADGFRYRVTIMSCTRRRPRASGWLSLLEVPTVARSRRGLKSGTVQRMLRLAPEAEERASAREERGVRDREGGRKRERWGEREIERER